MVSAALRYAASSSARRVERFRKTYRSCTLEPASVSAVAVWWRPLRPAVTRAQRPPSDCERDAMKLPRREFLRLAAAAAVPTAAVCASAQGYHTRPVRLILGFPAGGSTDLVARIIAAWLSERLGQSVVVENKPGGGTNLAVQTAVNSPPDGYTLLFVTTTNAINATFYPTLPFNF